MHAHQINEPFQNTYVQVRRPNQRNSKIEAVKCAKLMHASTARQAKGRQNKFGGDTRLSRSRSWRSPTTDAHRRPCSGFNVASNYVPNQFAEGFASQGLPTDRWLADGEQRVSRVPGNGVFFPRDDHARKVSHRESLLLITRRGISDGIARETPPIFSIAFPLQIKWLIIREVVLVRELLPRPVPLSARCQTHLPTSFCQ